MPSTFEQLERVVLENSYSKNWTSAVLEWEITDTDEDESCESNCVCGKENIRYLYTIENTIIKKKKKKTLFPIGSSCIKKFNRNDLNEQTSITEKLFKLYHAVGNNQFLSLSTDLFSRKLLQYLYKERAFYLENGKYDEDENYEFLLQMFNKKDKNSITSGQRRKITAILLNNIKPFVQKRLASKVKQSPYDFKK